MSDTTAAAPAAVTPATEANLESTESETADATEGTETPAAEQTADSGKAPAPEQKAKKPEPEKKGNKKTLKLKVDGQELDEEIDLDDEDSLVKHLQMSKVAQKRMAEKAQYEKQVAAFFDMLQNDPEKAFKEIGMDFEQAAIKKLQQKVEDEQKSPEQRELEKTKRELEEYRAQIKRQEDERKAAELERLQAEQERVIEDGMIQALEQTKLPNEPLVVKKIADIMLTALENKLDISPLQAAQIAKKELDEDMKSYVTALPDEMIEAWLGKERLSGMRKKQVAAVKKAAETANSVKQTGNNVTAKADAQKPVKKVSMSEFLRK